MQHLSILHFLLALMRPSDVQELFTREDIALLRSAKALGTAKVRDDCLEVSQGLYAVKQICDAGLSVKSWEAILPQPHFRLVIIDK